MSFWGTPVSWMLLCGILGEFAVPVTWSFFYPKYHLARDASGKLSNPRSPVRWLHRSWRVLMGTIAILAGISFYNTLPGPVGLRICALIFCIVFGLGARILPAILSVTDVYDVVSKPAKIHSICSSIGSFALQLASLTIVAAFCLTENYTLGSLLGLSSLVGIFAYALSVMSHRREFKGTLIQYQGIWEGVFLFFTYLPLAGAAILLLVSG